MAGDISRQNGKKGGRKKGNASIEAEKARAYIALRIGEYMPIIFDALILKAKAGDVMAIRELFDRGFGKPAQSVDMTSKGEKIDNSEEVKKLSNKFDVFFKELNH
jgi:hypothetical protein